MKLYPVYDFLNFLIGLGRYKTEQIKSSRVHDFYRTPSRGQRCRARDDDEKGLQFGRSHQGKAMLWKVDLIDLFGILAAKTSNMTENDGKCR